jgi:hypothetical protein
METIRDKGVYGTMEQGVSPDSVPGKYDIEKPRDTGLLDDEALDAAAEEKAMKDSPGGPTDEEIVNRARNSGAPAGPEKEDAAPEEPAADESAAREDASSDSSQEAARDETPRDGTSAANQAGDGASTEADVEKKKSGGN